MLDLHSSLPSSPSSLPPSLSERVVSPKDNPVARRSVFTEQANGKKTRADRLGPAVANVHTCVWTDVHTTTCVCLHDLWRWTVATVPFCLYPHFWLAGLIPACVISCTYLAYTVTMFPALLSSTPSTLFDMCGGMCGCVCGREGWCKRKCVCALCLACLFA